MKKFVGSVVALVLLSGCSLDYDDVVARESACKAKGGQVVRMYTDHKLNKIHSIRCTIDDVTYLVYPSGKLGGF